MAGWAFENAHAAIQSPPSIPFLVLLSKDGLCFGDICFAKIQTTLCMQTVSIMVLERWIMSKCFNPECMAEGDCSRSTAILIVLNPNNQGTALKCASVRLIVQRHMGPVGQIDDITKLIAYAHSQLKGDRHSSDNACKTFCIIMGDYGGSMGFATDPPFCTAYPLFFVDEEDLVQMTFWSPQIHPTFFTADVLLVRQLLTRDCPPHEYMRDRHHRCLLIPRGVHFLPDLFPQIIVPCNHTVPYSDPRSGGEAPFFTVDLFVSMDTLFFSAAGDLDLFNDEEVITLTHVGVLKSPITGTSNPHIPSPASRLEPDLSTRKQGYRDSLSCRHPVAMAPGSCEDLGKSEHEREAACKQLHRGISTEHTHTMSRDSTHGYITGDRCSITLKSGGSIDTGVSGERPHPKESRAERGRSRKHRRINSPERPPPPPFLYTPTAPSHPITGSLRTPCLDSNRGSLPLDRGVDAEVPVSSTGLVTPSSAHQPVQSSGQLTNVQVGSVLATSGLTAAQSEDIFLLSCEVQTLCGKLALVFIELSHHEP